MKILLALAVLLLLYGLQRVITKKILNERMLNDTRPEETVMAGERFIGCRQLFMRHFGALPNMHYMGGVDSDQIHKYLADGNQGTIVADYTRTYYDWTAEETKHTVKILVFDNGLIAELGDQSVELYYLTTESKRIEKLIEDFKAFRLPAKEQDHEINIITVNKEGLDLKALPIMPTELDIDLYYNDDFKAVDKLIRERLLKANDKGIILFHGLPGTGKTTYLRHLVGKLDKKVLFLSPTVAGDLLNPEFIDLLIDNPNSILIIEDAENIIMDRKVNRNSSVSNLLNLSDGLLSDCLNVQLICTFNSPLSSIDQALLRKGRLIARYEFDKLSVKKAQRLSDHLGISQWVTKPMTLAELTHPDELPGAEATREAIGFRIATMFEG